MSDSHNRDICVVGGGIAGLSAGIAFAQKGHSVTLHEQADSLREFGAGLQITPNGMRVLAALGLEDAANEISLSANAVVPIDALSGKTLGRFDLTSRSGYRFFHRADLLGLLAKAAENAQVDIQLNSKITPENHPNASLIVAAEGLHSKFRATLNGAAQPFFTGQTAWRAVIDADSLPEARIWMAPGAHVVTYPLPNGQLNIVAVKEQDIWSAEGWSHKDDPENLRTAFSHTCDALQSILAKVEETHLWGLFRHPVADVWQNGSIALIGDAAHPTLPFLAQGANLALEDAYSLAQTDDLANWQANRRPRALRAIGAANGNAKNYHLTGAKRFIAHNALKVIGKAAPNLFLNRLNWLYDFDVTAH